MNADDIAKTLVVLGCAPIVTEKLNESQRSRQVHPKNLLAAIHAGLRGQLKTIGWLNSTTDGISWEEEPIEWTAGEFENICNDIAGEKLSPEAVQIARREELEFMNKFGGLRGVFVEQCWKRTRSSLERSGSTSTRVMEIEFTSDHDLRQPI